MRRNESPIGRCDRVVRTISESGEQRPSQSEQEHHLALSEDHCLPEHRYRIKIVSSEFAPEISLAARILMFIVPLKRVGSAAETRTKS